MLADFAARNASENASARFKKIRGRSVDLRSMLPAFFGAVDGECDH
jgi:hypothetical protein